SPDGRRVAAGDQDGNLQLLDAVAGKLLCELKGHTDYITALAFSPDGKTLASGARIKGDSTLRFWDVVTGRQRGVLRGPGGVWAMTVRADGRVLTTAGVDGTVRLWDVPTRWKSGRGAHPPSQRPSPPGGLSRRDERCRAKRLVCCRVRP